LLAIIGNYSFARIEGIAVATVKMQIITLVAAGKILGLAKEEGMSSNFGV
jgi:hypothetical protein